MPSPDKTDRLLIGALLMLNMGLKLCWLGANELSLDEPFTVHWSQQSWVDLWGMLRNENNPPLFFLVIKLWSAITPFEAAWLRVPSAVFSALAVWPLFLLARALGGRRMGVVASLLFTCCNYHYGFAHEVRAYALFTLLTTVGMWLLVRATDRPGKEMRLMLQLSMLNVVLVYTHFFGWLVVGLQGLLVFVLPAMRPLRRGFLFGAVLTMCWFLPYGVIFLDRMTQSVGQGTWLAPPQPEEIYNMIWRWSNAPVIAVLFLLLIVGAGIRTWLRGSAMGFGLLWTFVPLTGMFLASYMAPMFLDRYLVYAAPGFALLVAASIEKIGLPERLTGALAALAVAGMTFTFAPWKDNGLHPSRVVAQVVSWRKGSEPVLLQPWWYGTTYAWHAKPDLLRSTNGLQWELGKAFIYPVENAAKLPVDLDTQSGVVLVDSGAELVDPQASVKAALRRSFASVDSIEADRKVWVYRFHR